VVGPFRASQNMAYYGNNTNGNPWGLISEAVTLADPSVNYANYDNDNDGTVDGVYVIFAGHGEEAGAGADAIWSHMSSINVTKDGKRISTYACSPEHRGGSGTSITRIGVICHEFGHVMGSRDFYDTNGSTDGSYEGTGSWDLMAGGSWGGGGVTPAHHNPYNKVYLYKWATATALTSGQNVTVQNAEQNNSFYRINTNTANEYYLLENRQKVGIDQAIPGHGLVIYHVDENNLSNQTAHQGLYPKSSGTVSSDKACFPGGDNKTQFTDATNPNMKSWAGANTGKPITSIVESNGVVSFKFMGGASTVGPAGYTKCADENQSYTLTGTCDVAYGANGQFYYQYSKTGTINFSNSTFGDPIPGVQKYGYYKTVVVGPAGYTKCADENQSYALSGTCDVAYGANGQFAYQYNKTGTINFNNSTFGDPIPGVTKYGYYKKINITSNDVIGFYTKQPIQNNWHAGVIEMSGSTMQWRNNAGVTWQLIPDFANSRLLTTSQCPYYNNDNGKAFTLKTRSLLGITIIDGFWFLDTFYSMSSNIAQNKGTAQSSTACGGVSSRATDGNTSGVWDNNSVTHTDYNAGAWWYVDLAANYDVNSVILWNRTECAERLSNFHVDFIAANGSTIIAQKNYSGTAGSKTVIDASATGVRFVRVQLNGTNYLSLAEVQVMGKVCIAKDDLTGLVFEETIPKTVELSQNYPNPFNPTTTISFSLPEAGSVKLSVMNAKGETVKVLASGNHQAGNHSFDFDGSGLNSGVYFYQLTTPEKTITKKMMLIK